MLLADVVATSERVGATSARRAKVDAIAALLRAAPPGEIDLVVRYLSGEIRQRRTGIGWAALRDLPPPAATASLDLATVDGTFALAQDLRGPGSAGRRRDAVRELFARATASEQQFLAQLVGGELRQGALAGVMADAVARAAGVELALVRRAAMLAGDLAAVASTALRDGAEGLAGYGLVVGRPVQPMLAQTSPSVADAMSPGTPAIVEWKIDGVRIQVHRDGDAVAVFSRSLDDMTARVPGVVELARSLPVRSIILDGELVALRGDGRPAPFQDTASRVASHDLPVAGEGRSLVTWFFDALHVDGRDLIDLAATARHDAAAGVLPEGAWVPRLVTGDVDEAVRFFEDAIERGHEGVVVKDADAPYEAGRRGAAWRKVKPRHTLDLVVLAAEWGHGRRQGLLSNLHLGARDPDGGFVMLGKTFKGLTDELLRWQTGALLERETAREGIVVHVRPELVVEIAFDGIQTSSRYPGGMALRFARVLRYRTDKRAADADSVDTVRALHERS